MKFNKEQITHIGTWDNGSTTYMRKNKCGQWNVLCLDRKGYRWDMLNYVNYPETIYQVTQEDLKEHLFESIRQVKEKDPTKYWYIFYKPTQQAVWLPFKRDYEKSTFFLCDNIKEEIDTCSYWVEGVANKLLRNLIEDNPHLKFEDFKVIEYEEED